MHAEFFQKRLRAMMAGAHRDPVLVEQGREIMRMNAVDLEARGCRSGAALRPRA